MSEIDLHGSSVDSRFFRALLEFTDDFILVCDERGRPVLWNDAYARIMKATLGIDMRPGLQPHTLLPDHQEIAWWEGLHRRVLGGERFRVDYALRLGEGPTRHFEFSYAPITAAGRVVGFCEISRDITRRKAAEEVLRDRDERYRLLLESTMAIPWEVDLVADRITYIGPQIEKLLGYPPESWQDFASWLGKVHPEDREAASRLSRERIARGEDHTLAVRMIAADGRSVWVRVVAHVVLRDGVPAVLRGYVFDVTDLKTIEEENARNRNLQALTTLAGGIAHDFNNLLTAVFGNVELAQSSADPAEKSELLEESLKAAERTRRLTEKLLAFSRGGVLGTELVDLGPLLLESAHFALSGSAHRLQADIAADLPPVEADRGQIEQLVQNLVINAREAMAEPGEVGLTARALRPYAGGGSLAAAGERVEITVRDHGRGILPEHLDSIFDPYFTTKGLRERPGHGLGLAVCRSIVLAHDGTIGVVSEPGSGTVFTVTLPAAAGPPPRRRPPRREVTRRQSPAKVLLMDDDEAVQDVVRGMLRRLGHTVRIAQNGGEAVEAFKAALASGAPFDVVILDETVRGASGGRKALQMLRAVDPTVRAILTSGYALPAGEASGFAAFLAKPFRLRDVEAALGQALSSASPAEGA